MEDWANWITNNGFAVAVAGYLLLRMETTIKELTKAVTVLTAKMGGENSGNK